MIAKLNLVHILSIILLYKQDENALNNLIKK